MPADGVANGRYSIVSVHSGKAFDVASAPLDDGANLHQWTGNGSGAQRSAIKAGGGAGAYSLRKRTSGRCADVAGLSAADGGNIQQRRYAATATQVFRFVR